MDWFLEMLSDAPIGYNGDPFGPNSDYVKFAKVKCENLDKLMAQLTPEQRDLFEAFSEADSQVEEIHDRRKFGYGFHLGALLLPEVMEGREKMRA